jgi:hypothetical protein
MAENVQRPTRAEEVRQERRKKPGATMVTGIKLGVDGSKLDRKTYEYRWANETGNRLQQLHGEDWDRAPELAADDGAKVAGTDENGKPFKTVLMRKRKDWYSEDQKAKQKPLEEMDKAIREGVVHHKSEPALRDGSYTPGSGNTIG